MKSIWMTPQRNFFLDLADRESLYEEEIEFSESVIMYLNQVLVLSVLISILVVRVGQLRVEAW